MHRSRSHGSSLLLGSWTNSHYAKLAQPETDCRNAGCSGLHLAGTGWRSMPTIVKCDQCEAQAVVKKIVGLFFADDNSGIHVLHVIECPNCGEREQPKTT